MKGAQFHPNRPNAQYGGYLSIADSNVHLMKGADQSILYEVGLGANAIVGQS